MSISSELLTLQNTKTAIRTAINNKGGSVGASDTFASYATAIDNLPSGGSGNPVIESIDVSDFTGTTFNRATSYITDVTIPSGVTSIGGSAFSGCTSMTSVNIPSGVTSLGQYAFQNCSALTSITIPSGVTSIGGSAFSGCTSLTGHITVPQITIEYDIPDSNTSIFKDCQNITSVTLTEGQTVLPNFMFNGCTRLASINIPSTVTKLGSNVFSSTAITGVVTIPSGVTEIGSQCFNQCPNITALVLLPTTPPYKQYASSILGNSSYPIYVPAASVDAYKAATNWRDYASRIFAIEDAILFTPTNGDPAISVKNYDLATANYVQSSDVPSTIKNGAGSLEISEGVTRIGMSAFQNGSSLTSVTLPSTMTRIDEVAFNGCSSLTSVTVNADTPPALYAAAFDSTNNCPIYVPRMSVDTYKAASGWSTYTDRIQPIPVTVATLTLNDTSTVDIIDTSGLGTIQQYQTSQYASTTVGALIKSDTVGISQRAFRNFANLASVTFETGSQCTDISTNAFQNCTSLTSITLPDLVSGIGASAFSGCTSLETVTIGDSITDIEGSAFAGCESLTDITILADAAPDGSGEDPFMGCDASITLHVPAESVSAYQAWLNDDLGTDADITVVAISE